MSDIDEQIGRNLTTFRGEMSQAELARLMKQRGFKWSQATVWAIEKGERPLRLSEAESVATILDTTTYLLTRSDEQVRAYVYSDRLDAIADRIVDAVGDLYQWQWLLAGHLRHERHEPYVRDYVRNIEQTALDLAAEGLVKALGEQETLHRINDLDPEGTLEGSELVDGLMSYKRYMEAVVEDYKQRARVPLDVEAVLGYIPRAESMDDDGERQETP